MFSRALRQALREAHFPHYLGSQLVAARVRSVWRRITRATNAVPHDTVRFQLHMTWRDKFTSHKYETDKKRILALLEIAELDLKQLESALYLRDWSDFYEIYLETISGYRVRPPYSARLVPKPQSNLIKAAARYDASHPATLLQASQSIDHATAPTYHEWESYAQTSKEPLMQLWRLLIKMPSRPRGNSPVKPTYHPVLRLNVFGETIPPHNQKLVVLKWAREFQKRAPKPVHPDAFQIIHDIMHCKPKPTWFSNLRKKIVPTRSYAKHTREIAREAYTVNEGENGVLKGTRYIHYLAEKQRPDSS